MKKLFISIPMAGRSGEDILNEMEELKAYAEKELGEPLEPIDSYFEGGDQHPLKFIGEAIVLLADADVVLFAEGWEQSRGCEIEHRCAVEYGGKTILYDKRFCNTQKSLSPCPFCGYDDALIVRVDRELSRIELSCAVCNTTMKTLYDGKPNSVARLVSRWNTRHNEAPAAWKEVV